MESSSIVAQSDSEPIRDYSPTTRWEPSEIITDGREILLDSRTQPGDYQLLVGMYHLETMTNLEVHQPTLASVLAGSRIVLAVFKVRANQQIRQSGPGYDKEYKTESECSLCLSNGSARTNASIAMQNC